MKIVSFKGEKIRGYQNHSIHFHDGVTFLIGINGSGKTTVLNLIQGLLTPSLNILDAIEYSNIEVEVLVDLDEKKFVISSNKSEDVISLSIQRGSKNSFVSEFSRYKLKNILEEEQIILDEMLFTDDAIEYKAYNEIRRKVKTPLFISLERSQNEQCDSIERRNPFVRKRDRINSMNINDCLDNIQDKIYILFRKNFTRQNKYINEFRNQVVKASLKFNSDVISSLNNSGSFLKEKSKIEKREKDFLEAIKGLENDDSIIKEAQNFFTKLKETLDIMLSKDSKEDERTDATMTWVLNNTQLLKIDEIIENGHSYQQKMEKLEDPINRFTHSVNLFFRESNKQLIISKTGDIKVLYSNYNLKKVNNIKELSSGEKQIIAMFGSLIFHDGNNTSDVYFVDEPEISLHLSWQDIYVDALLTACPNNQFILATHSPNIISDINRRDWCVDLSPNFDKRNGSI